MSWFSKPQSPTPTQAEKIGTKDTRTGGTGRNTSGFTSQAREAYDAAMRREKDAQARKGK